MKPNFAAALFAALIVLVSHAAVGQISWPLDDAPTSHTDDLVTVVEGIGSILLGIAAIVLVFAIYFLPSLVAGSRKHHQGMAIFVLNLFAGWTFFGWVIALVWSFTAVIPQKLTAQEQAPH